jgi:hypothetical protein
MSLKTILNTELDKIRPEVEKQIDAALQDLKTRIFNHTPDSVRQFLVAKIKTIHGNALLAGVLELVVENFDFAPYVAKGGIQIDKLGAELKRRIEGARY